MIRKQNLYRRKGATTVEFAIVAPVLFLLVFSIFELARLMMFSGNVNTALLTGVRQASLATSTATEVDDLIREELRRYGIVEAQISFTPSDYSPSDNLVQIDIEVPVNSTNGLHMAYIALNESKVSKSISVDREAQ